jgi:hypothetical protein
MLHFVSHWPVLNNFIKACRHGTPSRMSLLQQQEQVCKVTLHLLDNVQRAQLPEASIAPACVPQVLL